MINREIFSNRLKQLRAANNKTMVDVAEYLGIKKNSVFTWETMKTVPSADNLVALADYFQVSLDYLVGRSDKP